MRTSSSDSPSRPGAIFRTTQWGMVLNAGSNDSVVAGEALEELCRRYWYPLYAYVRRSGYAHADAADLTQSFFRRVIEKEVLTGVAPGVTRFRSFLLAVLKNFLINEWQKENCAKRGGRRQIFSLDETADDLYRAEPADNASPDKLFEKHWALSVIEVVLTRLRRELGSADHAELFEALKPALTGEKLHQSYSVIGTTFGVSEESVKQAVHRLRKRFRELLFAEVAQTVHDASDVEDEVRHLISALGA
jgi:RNA polymerase sigma factor (sigma-70 family)